MMQPGRIISHAAVFLLLGAIVNVAVAWVAVPFENLMQYADGRMLGRRTIGGRLLEDSNEYWLAASGSGVTGTWYRSRIEQHVMPDTEMSPEDVLDGLSLELSASSRRDAQSRGWPMRALWCEILWNESMERDSIRAAGGWVIPHDPKSLESSPSVPAIPLRPLWPGFAINTILYAALMWLLFCGPSRIRRLVRIRKGRCPSCGYQIAPGVGNNCSECGTLLRGSS